MFRIKDERNHFYQWDIDRQLIVEDTSITQVHFTNRTNNTALVCEVIDGLVNVPNILLQEDWDIIVYAYDKNHTRFDESFEVKKRNKPDNYVYTETEVLNFNTLLNRVNTVDENIENTVNEYLRENPPQVDLTGYATEKYVDDAIAEIPEPDFTGLATENYVDKAVANSKIGYATEDYVDNAIANLDIPEAGGNVDLSNYYTKNEVDALIPAVPDTSGFITMPEVEAKGYQTAQQVSTAITNALNNIGVAEEGVY